MGKTTDMLIALGPMWWAYDYCYWLNTCSTGDMLKRAVGSLGRMAGTAKLRDRRPPRAVISLRI